MPPDREQLEAAVRHLASFDRPSASPGERRAAEWIAERLRSMGHDAHVEEERAHGGYWWPLGLLNLAAGLAGWRATRDGRPRGRRRALAAGVGAFSAAGIWDDLGLWRHWFRRLFLPKRSTWNVVAEAGDPSARETVVLVSHHDAAHSGLIFTPGLPELMGERFPRLWDRVETSPPLMYLVFGGPLLVALGALLGRRRPVRAGSALALACTAAFADIAARSVVPGANDNLSGVATLLGVAAELERRPLENLRVVLVSTGSEESFEEGMQGFARRHFATLPREHTSILVLEAVGSENLVVPEGEGMLVMRDYDAELKDLLSACAAEHAISLRRGLRFSFGSDALVGLRHGYRTAMLGSVNRYKAPGNYHWPTDNADNADYDSICDAVRLADAAVRTLAERAAPSAVGLEEAA